MRKTISFVFRISDLFPMSCELIRYAICPACRAVVYNEGGCAMQSVSDFDIRISNLFLIPMSYEQ